MTTAAIDIAPLPQATFGKTGEHVPLLGLGTAPGGFGLADADAIPLFERAIDLGVTYIDTAPGYERAQSPDRPDRPSLSRRAVLGQQGPHGSLPRSARYRRKEFRHLED